MRANRVRGVFLSPSPHYLACGSALGGSRRSPGRSRVVNPDPHFLDRDESLFDQPFVGHSGMSGKCTGKTPVSLAAKGCEYGCPF